MSIKRVGLTGGIGSGKSSVANIFAGLGVPVLDLDQVGRDLLASGSDGLHQLTAAFGTAILNADGSLNRAHLAHHCFADAAETSKLNNIMHPLIRQAEDEWLKLQQGCYAIIEASVLLESGGESRMDKVVVVLADMELRRSRVLARGDRNSDQFDAIIARQCTDNTRHKYSNLTILNNSNFNVLQKKVLETHKLILEQLNN